MKKWFIYIGSLYFLSTHAVVASPCSESKIVPMDQLLSNPARFLNKRIQTHAILRTDGKEYVRISLDENSKFSILTTADDESSAYYDRYNLSSSPSLNVFSDLAEKLRVLKGEEYKQDRSKIRYYRQSVMACGRLVQSTGGLRFAVDDMHVNGSYLLPWVEGSLPTGGKQ